MDNKDFNETLKCIYEGKHLLFTFKSEAEEFAQKAKLTIEYEETNFIDEQHYNVKGYESKLYWICQ